MRYVLPTLLLLLAGCASYEYDLVQPADVKTHAGTKEFSPAKIDPLRYDLITVESKLVMQIHNPTDRPITLLGNGSYVLDADGRSCNVQGITIAPKSYAKFIFPPPRPYVEDRGGLHFGVGTGYDTAGGFRDRRVGVGTGVGYETGGPRPMENLDENFYWEWEGESAVKFHFVFSDDGNTFAHDLVLQRVKN